jgi:serine/threonine protein kinase
MSLCINPNCKQSNSEQQLFCKSCGSEILLLGRYQVVRLLSEKGGFADTYEVMHHGVMRVLKVLKDSNPKAIELFQREFEVLNQSDHPGIPKAEEYFEFMPRGGSVPLQCLVMEKILGTDLEEYVKQCGKPIDERCAIEWLDQLVHILQVIHDRKLLHRDIKPSNIILQPDGQLALIDFGAVGRFDLGGTQSPISPTFIYTPGYAAPEQTLGKAVPESDFFSLGRTFVYLLTGRQIVEMLDADRAFNWETHVRHISPGFVSEIDRMMREPVGERPRSATEIIDWVTNNRSISKSHGNFHNKPIGLPIHSTPPIPTSQTAETVIPASTVPSVNSTPTAAPRVPSSVPITQVVNPNAKSPDPKKSPRKGAIIAGAIAAIALLGTGAYGIGRLLNNKSAIDPVAKNDKNDGTGGTAVAASQCSAKELVKKSGNLYGVIEIGSKGIKAEVIQELDKLNDAGFKYIARDDKEDIESRNVNATVPSTKNDTVAAVTGVMAEMQQRFSIPCEQIVIYGSSGLAKKAPHKDELLAAIETATGRKMEFISAADEAKYVFDGVVPDWRRSEVISVDIGSGNTKGAFLKSGQKEDETYSVPVGTADFSREIDKKRGDKSFTLAAEEQKKAIVIPEIRNAIQLKPALLNSPRIYLAGGISWALATLTHPCDKEQTVARKEERVAGFTKLRAEDINTFYNNATRDRKTLFQPNLSACTPEQLKRVQKDINKIKTDAFSENDLIAGAEILRAFSQELKFSEKESIFFARYAIEALPIGYLIQQLEKR